MSQACILKLISQQSENNTANNEKVCAIGGPNKRRIFVSVSLDQLRCNYVDYSAR